MIKCAAVALALITANALALGADLKGSCDPCCHSVAFHLTNSSSQQPKEEITLRLELGGLSFSPYLAGPDWWNTQGQRCSKPDHCEEIKTAKLQFQKISGKRASGNYVLEFNDRRVEGQFSVKQRHEGKPCICE